MSTSFIRRYYARCSSKADYGQICELERQCICMDDTDFDQIMPDKKVTDPSPKAQDVQLGETLWNLCNQMLKKAGISD